MRPRVKFLTTVWNEAYVERFATLSLPSFLAPGNLPALAAACELEVVIMTARRDVDFFEKHAAFRALRAIAPVRFIHIDDLIVAGLYGLTLTLAYARAIFASGEEMTKTHFVFMNADFVLADGSLASLSRHILAGRSIVLGPSFRATAEAVEPHLRAAVSESKVLSMGTREMAALSLPHAHPTTLAKVVNQGLCHATHPNQFFWRLDEQTILGRYYLIFMLCLRPERTMSRVNSYCDYGFIPEMCPSGDEAVMADSDEFFMLELQRREQEMAQLLLGQPTEETVAATLSRWTTREHRRAARHDIVFHGGPLPASMESARREASAFIERIGRRLGAPVPHENHPYWVGGLGGFRQVRAARGLPPFPPEVGGGGEGGLSAVSGGLRRLVTRVVRTVIGLRPRVTLFSPHWLDYVHLNGALKRLLRHPAASVLVVRERPELLDPLLEGEPRAEFITLSEVLASGVPAPKSGAQAFASVLIYLFHNEARYLGRLVEQCVPGLRADGECHVFIHRPHGAMVSEDLLFEMVRFLEDSGGRYPDAAVCSYVGSSLKSFNDWVLGRAGEHYGRFGLIALAWIAPAIAVLLPLTLVSNLYLRLTMPSDEPIRSTSSVLVRVIGSAASQQAREAAPHAARRAA